MIAAGDVVSVDLGRETRQRAVVVSNAHFHRLGDRAVLVPEYNGPTTTPPMPWHVTVADGVYAVDAVLSVRQDAVLGVVSRATAPELERVLRALRHITG